MKLFLPWIIATVCCLSACGSEVPPGQGSGGGGPLVDCERGSTAACRAFISADGTSLRLGRYGAVMEPNVGSAFANQLEPSDNQETCELFLNVFGLSTEQTADWLELGTLDLTLYTVYRPANWRADERYPLVAWGNGTCLPPEAYGALLRYLASQGMIVVAPNARFVGSGVALRRALDFALSANADPSSPYYRRIDASKIAVLGHSQGGLGATAVSADARIKASVVFNAANNSPAAPFLIMSGDRDVAGQSPSNFRMQVDAAPQAAYLFFHMVPGGGVYDGYFTLIDQPERVSDVTAAWLSYRLNGDAASRRRFVGRSCGLCNNSSQYEYGQHGLN